MTEQPHTPDRDTSAGTGRAPEEAQDHRTPCADIQDVLFDYMSRELGAARSDLVRRHLRKCADCQRAASEMQATLELMQRTSREEAARIPDHLSADRRQRMIRAVTHPVLDWAYRHHILVSILIAAAVLTALALFLRTVHMGRTDIPSTGYPIRIGGGPPAGNEGEGTVISNQ